jgi:hypothetical protein
MDSGISEREEQRALGLAARQPRSARTLAEVLAGLQKRVVAAALADRKVQRRLANTRYGVIAADYVEEKPTGRTREPSRLAEVGFYDYDHDVLVVAVVKLRSGAVVRVEERLGFQPRPSEEEVERAQELALSDPKLDRLRRLRTLRVVALPVRGQDDKHRRVHLYFWSGGRTPRPVGDAVIDLSVERIVSATLDERR